MCLADYMARLFAGLNNDFDSTNISYNRLIPNCLRFLSCRNMK